MLKYLMVSTLLYGSSLQSSPTSHKATEAHYHFRNWVGEVMSMLSLSYSIDSPLPPFVVYNQYHNCNSNDSSIDINILIFGDSVDRRMVDMWCVTSLGNLHMWGHNFSYESKAPPARVCIHHNIKFAMINLYGSSRYGPYLHNIQNTPDDPYAATELRLQHGLSQYRETYGDPNFVLFRTDLWDLLAISRRSNTSTNETEIMYKNHTIFHQFIQDYKWAFHYLRTELPHAYLGTHTVPKIRWGLHLFHQYQNALRHIFWIHPDIFLYDFELLMNNLDPRQYLIDLHHPNANYTTSLSNIFIDSIKAWSCYINSK
eukprot:gene8421-17360_t